MPSIFSKIILGEIPCYKVAESEHCLAFLDINPLTKGHLLVIPKTETDYIFDLENKTYTEFICLLKQSQLL
jgi:histidine triad (HIT) family protein